VEWIAEESKLGTFNAGMSNPEVNKRSKQLILPNFLVTYTEQSYIDYFDEKCSLLHRVDLAAIFEAYEDL